MNVTALADEMPRPRKMEKFHMGVAGRTWLLDSWGLKYVK